MSGVSIYIHYAGGKYVRASDYDRDTQELRNELNACKSPPGGCGYWREASRLREAERDELRAQVEAMRMELNEVLAMYPFRLDRQSFVINGGAALCADGDDEFYSAKMVHEVLGNIRAHIKAALQAKPC